MQHPISRACKRLFSHLSKVVFTLGIVLFLAACGEKSAEDHFNDSAEFIANGNQEAAIVALKNAIQAEPRMSKARFALGKLYLELNNFDSASKELSFALDAGYSEKEIIPLLAEALHRTNANVALADLEYDESLFSPAELVEIGYRQAHAVIVLQKKEESKALINKLLAINTQTIYKTMVKGLQLATNLDYPEALEEVKGALQQDPLNRDAIDLTARLYVLNNDPETAARLYEDYIKVAPEDLEAKFSLANMLLQQKQPQRAEKYIDELLKVNVEHPALNQLKAIVRAAADDYVSAKKFAEKAINSGRNDFSLRMVAGLASFQLKDYQSTIKHFSPIAVNLADNHPALRMLAASQLELDMDEDASEVLSRVTNVSENDFELFSRAGYELIKSGNTEAANILIEQSEKISDSADDLTQLGVLKLSLDNLDGIVDLEGAVEKAPLSAKAKETLAGAYLGTNQFQKALKLAKDWQSDEPSNVGGYLLESEVYQRQKQYGPGAAALAKASNIDSTNLSVQLAKIRLALRQEKRDEALAVTEAVLESHPSNVTALASLFQLKLQEGNPAPAMDRIEAQALQNLDNEPLIMLASRTMLARNKFFEAIELLNNVEPSRLTSQTYWEVKGTALLRTNQLSDAYEHFTKWARLFPNQSNPTIGLLRVLDAQGNFKKAAAIAADFVAQNDSPQINLMKAYYLTMSQDVRGAKEVLNNIDSASQSLPFVRGIKARIALLENRGAQGIEDAKASYTDNASPNNLLVYVQTLDSAKRSDEALRIIEQHVEKAPNDKRSLALLAERKIAQDPSAALAIYEEMIPKLPNNPVILNNAGYLLMQDNKLDKAFQYSSRAVEISPQNVDFADTYAQILMRRNQAGQAVETYNKVMGPAVRDENIILNYIEAMLVNKDNSAARRKIQEFNSRIKSKDGKARLLILQATYMQ